MALPVPVILLGVQIVLSLAIGLLTPRPKQKQTKLAPPEVPNSEYGTELPQGNGIKSFGGSIIWAKDPVIRSETPPSQDGGGSKGSRPAQPAEQVAYLTFGTVFTANRSLALRRLWLNSKLVLDYSVEPNATTAELNAKWQPYVRYYSGQPGQTADPTYADLVGVNNANAFLNFTTIVFKDLPAREFGNAYPGVKAEFTFEGGLLTLFSPGNCAVPYNLSIDVTKNKITPNSTPVLGQGNGSPPTSDAALQTLTFNRTATGAICGVRVRLESRAYDYPVDGYPAPTFAPPDNYGVVELLTQGSGVITIAEGFGYGIPYELPEPTPTLGAPITFAYDYATAVGTPGTARITSIRRVDGLPDSCAPSGFCNTNYPGISVYPPTNYISNQEFSVKDIVDQYLRPFTVNNLVQFDTTELAPFQVRGWSSINGSFRDNLEDLLLPFQFEALADGNKIKFSRGNRDIARFIDMDYVGLFAGESSGTIQQYADLALAKIKRPRQVDVPTAVRFRFDDGDLEDQPGQIVFHRNNLQTSDSGIKLQDFSTRIGMGYVQAYDLGYGIAARLTQRTYEIEFVLPMSYADILPGDILTLDYRKANVSTNVKVLKVTYAPDFTLKIESVAYGDQAIVQAVPLGTVLQPPPLRLAATPTVRVLQLPFIGNQTTEDVIYAYASGGQPGQAVSVSISDSEGSVALGALATGVPEGRVQTTLNPVLSEGWYDQSVSIQFSPGTTVEVFEFDEIHRDLYLNLLLVGEELIKFREATNLGGGLWRFDGLLRGLWGTDVFGHLPNEQAIVWIPSLVPRITVPRPDYLKSYGVTYESGGTVTQTGVTYIARSRQPYSVSNIQVLRDTGTGNVTLSWLRRSRGILSWPNAAGYFPLGEVSELYRIELWNTTATAIVQTTQQSTPSLTLTPSQQTTLFGSPLNPGDLLRFSIYQVGSQPNGTQDLLGFSRYLELPVIDN